MLYLINLNEGLNQVAFKGEYEGLTQTQSVVISFKDWVDLGRPTWVDLNFEPK